MRTQFAREETSLYQDTVRALLRLCGPWCREHGRAEPDPLIVRCACDARHHFGDGRFTYWTTDLLSCVLLDWFPRAAWLPRDSWEEVVPTLHVWIDFLDACGLLDPRGEPALSLHPALDDVAARFPVLMADTTLYGTSKVLTTALHRQGTDPGDPQARQAFLDSIARGDSDLHPHLLLRARLVDLRYADQDERPLPQLPVEIPPVDELKAAAGGSPVVRDLLALTGWIGPQGRDLTPATHLHPADAAELTELLEITRRSAEGRQGRDTSARAGLPLLLGWAKKTGLVRQHRGRLVQVKSARHLHDNPLALYSRAFNALFGMRDQLFPDIHETSCLYELYPTVLQDVLFAVYSFPPPGVDLAVLEASVWATCTSHYGFDTEEVAEQEREKVRGRVVRDFRRAVSRLVELGTARLTLGREGADHLELTPLGTSAVRDRLLSLGRPAPLLGDLTDSDAHTLLFAIVEEHTLDTGREEITRWLSARGVPMEPTLSEVPDTPAVFQTRTDLSDALRRTPLRTRKAALLEILTRSLPEGHTFAETLLHDPDLAPLAVQDLLSTGHRSIDSLGPEEGLLGLAESLAQLLEIGGPEALATQFAAHSPQVTMDVLAGVAKSAHPHADRILRAARTLPVVTSRHERHGGHPHGGPHRGPGPRGGRRHRPRH